MRLVRWLLRKPPYWMPTLKGPLRPLWPLYRRWSWWQELAPKLRRHGRRRWSLHMGDATYHGRLIATLRWGRKAWEFEVNGGRERMAMRRLAKTIAAMYEEGIRGLATGRVGVTLPPAVDDTLAGYRKHGVDL